MNRILLGLTLAGSFGVFAADLPDPSQTQIDDIIQKFAAKESDFRRARGNYTYRQTARVLDLDEGGATVGRWKRSPTSSSRRRASAPRR